MIDYTKLPALLTIEKAANIMGVSRDFVYKALRNNDLPTAIIGGKRWILRDHLLKQMGILGEEGFITPNTFNVQVIQRLDSIVDILKSINQSLQKDPYRYLK